MLDARTLGAIDAAQAAREPSIVRAPDGALYVAGYWGPVRYTEKAPSDAANAAQAPLAWKSVDDGATWRRLSTGTPVQGAVGNSDVSLAVDRDGRVYLASLEFGFAASVAVNMISIGASDDGGATWHWAKPLEIGAYVDRPWVRVAPDGIPHAVWNDGKGIHHATSNDHGATWTEGALVSPDGGDAAFDIAPDGALAVRVVPVQGNGLVANAKTDGVTVSTDQARTWQARALPGNRSWAQLGPPSADGVTHVWDALAFDGRGALHAAWAEKGRLVLATSDDLGATWRERDVPQPIDGQPVYPFLRPAGEGALLTWYVWNGSDAAALGARIGGAINFTILARSTGSQDHGEYFEGIDDADGIIAAVPTVRDGGEFLVAASAR